MPAAVIERTLADRLQDRVPDAARLAWELFGSGDFQGALKLYEALQSSFPDSAELLGLIGITLLRLGRVDEAEGFLRDGLQLKADDPPLLAVYGATLGMLGGFEGALEYSERVLQTDVPAALSSDALHNKVLALLNLNRTQEAADALEELSRLGPEHPDREELAI